MTKAPKCDIIIIESEVGIMTEALAYGFIFSWTFIIIILGLIFDK